MNWNGNRQPHDDTEELDNIAQELEGRIEEVITYVKAGLTP